jgi:hypothetical protein
MYRLLHSAGNETADGVRSAGIRLLFAVEAVDKNVAAESAGDDQYDPLPQEK